MIYYIFDKKLEFIGKTRIVNLQTPPDNSLGNYYAKVNYSRYVGDIFNLQKAANNYVRFVKIVDQSVIELIREQIGIIRIMENA